MLLTTPDTYRRDVNGATSTTPDADKSGDWLAYPSANTAAMMSTGLARLFNLASTLAKPMCWLRHLSSHLRVSSHRSTRCYSQLDMQRVRIPDKMEIHLTKVESEICTLLDGCTDWMRDEHGVNTSCRIAGGWVRDKVSFTTSDVCLYLLPSRIAHCVYNHPYSFWACRAMTLMLL